MAGFLTDYLNNKILDSVFGGASLTSAGTLYVGLSLSSANKSGTVTEPTSGGYARVQLVNNLSTFSAAAGGTKTNAVGVAFPQPTGDWGTVQSLFISDAPAGGNIIAMADLTTSRAILNGSPAPSIAAGALFLSHA